MRRRRRPPPEVVRNSAMTAEQVRLARRLRADGRLDDAAIAAAFWVTPETLRAHLAGERRDGDAPHRAS